MALTGGNRGRNKDLAHWPLSLEIQRDTRVGIRILHLGASGALVFEIQGPSPESRGPYSTVGPLIQKIKGSYPPFKCHRARGAMLYFHPLDSKGPVDSVDMGMPLYI